MLENRIYVRRCTCICPPVGFLITNVLLLQENLPDLHEHMLENRIETHMYASQWFLTLYTAKFPLSIVFRILDIYLCEVSVSIVV